MILHYFVVDDRRNKRIPHLANHLPDDICSLHIVAAVLVLLYRRKITCRGNMIITDNFR